MIVQKYGGSSVSSHDRLRGVAKHIIQSLSRDERVLVVISAMGDHTDTLLSEAKAINPNPPKRELDLLLSAGERISMSLLSIAIAAEGYRSQSFTGSQSGIITDSEHGNARIASITPFRILNAFQEVPIVIVAGFQGVSGTTKDVTTLGRGGSDLTAIALAKALGANSCELYKDVDGIFTSDPSEIPSSRLVEDLSFEQLCELTTYGAGVVHSRAANLAFKERIKFSIRNSFSPTNSGTNIGEPQSMEHTEVKAITSKLGLTSYVFSSDLNIERLSEFVNHLSSISCEPLFFQTKRIHDSYELHLVTENSLPEAQVSLVDQVVLKEKLDGIGCITMVGTNLLQRPLVQTRCLKHFEHSPPLIVDHQNLRISFYLNQNAVLATTAALHGEFFA